MAKSMGQYLQEGNRMKVGTGSFFLLYTVETEQVESSHVFNICVFANVNVWSKGQTFIFGVGLTGKFIPQVLLQSSTHLNKRSEKEQETDG